MYLQDVTYGSFDVFVTVRCKKLEQGVVTALSLLLLFSIFIVFSLLSQQEQMILDLIDSLTKNDLRLPENSLLLRLSGVGLT